ncbi:MAG: polysaccharide biosynthesis protein [Zoogloeaceae bacterium]|jgi:FlaA1/EpsC-like NDP-sugar epimerase|nr:polysaccharide biosynthesis protein [Zoogloeaceae bacterium]
MVLRKFAQTLLSWPRPVKRIVAMVLDIILCALTVWLAFFLRLDVWVGAAAKAANIYRPSHAFLASVVIALPIFIRSGFYRAIFRYSGTAAIRAIGWAMLIYGVLYAALLMLVRLPGVPRTIGFIQPLLLFIAIASSRLFVRYWLGGLYLRQFRLANLPRALIYGAGNAGKQLAAALAHSQEIRVVGFLDDNASLHGHTMDHLPIHDPARLPDVAAKYNIVNVLLALPSVNRRRRNEILAQIAGSHVAVRSLPNLTELAQGKISISALRDPDIDDLLGRAPVEPDPQLFARNITGKTVLVTGAGGSIGSELCRQILMNAPRLLLLVDQSEFALYSLHHELAEKQKSRAAQSEIIPLLASVRDAARMADIMASFRPDTLYHAAAYKHVPLVEHNPVEGLKNNALGTLVTALAAREHGVANFVLVSTDKAVRPASIMGASKRLAEMILQALAAETREGETRFSMVRFGNVLGSSGSVVPRFREQIRAGGPITLTHPDIARYFMTIPEAAQLVIQAGAMVTGRGGDVFVLDMGEPVRIKDLARRMVELSGLTLQDESNPDGDIAVEIIGLRPGEKLYEELLIGDDPRPTGHPRIMRAEEHFLPWRELSRQIETLQTALARNDLPQVRQWLAATIAGYTPAGDRGQETGDRGQKTERCCAPLESA